MKLETILLHINVQEEKVNDQNISFETRVIFFKHENKNRVGEPRHEASIVEEITEAPG